VASIDSMLFDQPAGYAVGQTISLTVAYTPDTPSVTPETFTATTIITDPTGAETASGSADFIVNEPGQGDTLITTDTGSRTWTEASNDGTTAVFNAIA
jgi:hypothetical protein